MAETTKISYCDATANAWWSCSRVHVGCTSCYAEQLAGRFGISWGPSAPRRYMPGWRKVLAKVAGRAEREGRTLKVFLNDMSDLFDDHEGEVVDQEKNRLWINGDRVVSEAGDFTGAVWRAEGFEPLRISHLRQQVFTEVDRYADRLTFLMLTKRPQNIRRMTPNKEDRTSPNELRFRRNAWLLYSASDQASLHAGFDAIASVADLALVWGLSLEPLIGPIDLGATWYTKWKDRMPKWAIVGGESGPRHRPMEIGWLESIAEQCEAAGVPLYVKQDCGLKPGQQGRIPDSLWSLKQFPKEQT